MGINNEISATLTSSAARKDERRLQAMIHARVVKTNSSEEFETVCAKFRQIVKEIAKVIGDPEFRGEYSKICEISNPYVGERGDIERALEGLDFEMKIRKLLALDQECKYQGYKLGYSGNQWFKECWRKNKR